MRDIRAPRLRMWVLTQQRGAAAGRILTSWEANGYQENSSVEVGRR
jgi:hypothetical protein